MKKFFKEKLTDIKFSRAGPGHKLNEEPAARPAPTTKRKGYLKYKETILSLKINFQIYQIQMYGEWLQLHTWVYVYLICAKCIVLYFFVIVAYVQPEHKVPSKPAQTAGAAALARLEHSGKKTSYSSPASREIKRELQSAQASENYKTTLLVWLLCELLEIWQIDKASSQTPPLASAGATASVSWVMWHVMWQWWCNYCITIGV